ncbi:MAG: MATE family efflux transporter [Bacteroidales bacterium]
MRKKLRQNMHYYSALTKLALPLIIGQLGLIVVGLADNMMVGHHNTNELAAASFVNSIFSLATLFGLGFSYGLTPLIGKFTGEKNYQKSGHALRNSLIANGIFGIILTFIILVIYLNIDGMGQPIELLSYIRPYFLLQSAGLILIMLFNGFKQFFDGIGDAWQSMKVMLIANIVNIIGNYALIYGNWGFPEMGLNGAGISTLVSRILLPLLMAISFFIIPTYKEYRKGFSTQKASLGDVMVLAKNGLPISFQIGLEASAFNLSAIMIGWVGATALAAHQVMMGLTTLGYLIYYGLGSAITILSSKYLGQNKNKEAVQVAHCGVHLILAWCLFLIPTLAISRNSIGLLFTNSQEVVELVALLVIPTLFYQVADGIQIGYANALRGIGDMKPMPYISFFSFFIVCLPVSYFMGIYLGWGAIGIWYGFPIALIIAAFLFYGRYRYQTRQLLRMQFS